MAGNPAKCFLEFFDLATMKLHLGGGTIGGLVLFKYAKPSAQVRHLRPNLEHGARVEISVVLWQEKKTISRRGQDASMLTCTGFYV
jgi:hypothetical protein